MFSVHTTLEESENATVVIYGFVFQKISGREIT